MPSVMQEKFQIEVPNQPDGSNEWASDKSARSTKGTSIREGKLPPGTNIESQETADLRKQPLVFSGEDDISADNNPEARKSGYTRRMFRGTDDEYTRQHNDAFYDEITVDGQTGFLERNNVLDRH